MTQWSDMVVGVLVVAVVGYIGINSPQGYPKEAVLAEISYIMNDLESQLQGVEQSGRRIPPSTVLPPLLEQEPHTALVGKVGDPWLMPDITERANGPYLGGCVVTPNHWILLRTDHAALTQIPTSWDASEVHVCLDRNGAKPPNMEGYDVIWLLFSRERAPHVTLIPVSKGKVSRS